MITLKLYLNVNDFMGKKNKYKRFKLFNTLLSSLKSRIKTKRTKSKKNIH